MISVALCTYNGEKYIEKQLKSILFQSMPVNEVVICDDNSSDNTVRVIKNVQDMFQTNVNIRIYVNEKKKGVTKNFESALGKCKGNIIFLSDQDDIWDQKKVEKIMAVFKSDNECMLVFTNAFLVDSEGHDLGKSLWEITSPVLKKTYTVNDFTGNRYITGATVAIRRELLEHTIPIPESWIHDAWLAANASVFGNIKYIDEKLICYRQHENNVIGAKRRSLVEQVRYTKANIQKSIIFRETMGNRFSSLNNLIGYLLTDAERENLRSCIEFWNDTGKIVNSSKLQGVRIILRHLLNGNYNNYNHGLYGAMVDLFILINSNIPIAGK